MRCIAEPLLLFSGLGKIEVSLLSVQVHVTEKQESTLATRASIHGMFAFLCNDIPAPGFHNRKAQRIESVFAPLFIQCSLRISICYLAAGCCQECGRIEFSMRVYPRERFCFFGSEEAAFAGFFGW